MQRRNNTARQEVVEDAARKVLQGKLDIDECLDALESDAAVYFLRLLFQDLLEQNCNMDQKASAAVSNVLVSDETGDEVVRALKGDERALRRLFDALPAHIASELIDDGTEVLQENFQQYLQKDFGLDKQTAATISKKLVCQKTAVTVEKALDGDQASMHALLKGLSANFAVLVWRPQFKTWLQANLGLDGKTAENISTTFVNEKNVDEVIKAMEGDQNAVRRLTKQVQTDFAMFFVMSLFK